MKKRLLIAFAICVLFLSACSSFLGTSRPSSNAAVYSSPIATASAQSVCQILYDRQTQFNQEYHTASVQFASAQAQGNSQQAGEAEKTLIRLHQSILQVEVQLKAC
jgi:protein involved in sex pheromone biosynthesis